MAFCKICSKEGDVPAVYKYHQLAPMCEEHYKEVISQLEEILHHKIECHTHLIKDNLVLEDEGRTSWDDE